MPELAKAYVQIIPSAEGIKGRLTEALGGEAESAGESAGSSFGSGFGKTVGTIAKVGVAALGAAATAVGALGKQAVEGFAEFEQLQGGLETMFEDLSWDVGQNASKAFQTAGLSANEYMETVMGFSASLNASLVANEGNIARAADLSDQIIIDMADNANKMGSSMESIQNAYSGFAKQNYTMLDNLKLGYGGTKEEMERLLADAGELAGVEFDISNFADVAEAIHIIQNEMGITGTTAAEASATISGSLGMLSASWSNLVTGIANPDADIGALIGDVVSSAEAAAGNLLPAIQTALSGIGQLITGLAPTIVSAIPVLITDVLPGLTSAALSLVEAAVSTFMDNFPMLLETGVSLLLQVAEGISAALPELVPVAIDAILQLVETLTDPANLNNLVTSAISIIMALVNGLIAALPQLLAQAPVIISNLVQAIITAAPQLLTAALELIVTIGRGIIDNLGQILSAAGEIVTTVVNGVTSLASTVWGIGTNIVEGIWQGISNGFTWITNKISGWVSDVLAFFKMVLGIASPSKVFASQIGMNMALGIGAGLEDGIGDVEAAMGDVSDAAINAWKADQLSASISGAAAYSFGGPNEAVAGSAGGSDDIMSAIYAVGNMIVAAVNAIDPDITLDGERLADKLYQYNAAAAQRHGAAMVT